MASPPCSSLLRMALLAFGLVLAPGPSAVAQQRRARPPQYPKEAFRGVFFEDVSEALRGERPRVEALGPSSTAPASRGGSNSTARSPNAGPMNAANAAAGDASGGGWPTLVDAVHLEDEVKRLKLQYDELVTTPSRFRSGGFQDARETLSILAMLMAVIADYEGRVRFQDDAGLARDLFARSAKNVTAGSDATFDEAKQRKADLQDLVNGTGLNRTAPTAATDWTLVGARIPLMNYLEDLLNEPLQSETNDAAAVEQSKEELDRAAALVAVVAEVLKQEGMDDADDPDYRQFSDAMQQAARDVRAALAENDAEGVRQAVGQLGQSCSACHEQYR